MESQRKPTLLSLFTGAGGLDIGMEVAGFNVALCVEKDLDCRKTIAINRPNWKLSKSIDIFTCSPKQLLQEAGLSRKKLDFLSGGPPCQPFSKASFWVHGKTKRLHDERAMTISSYMDILEYSLPKAFLMENVEGLMRAGQNDVLELLTKRIMKINKSNNTNYKITVLKLDASDYGVPQIRNRVFIIGDRKGNKFILPTPTYGNGNYRKFTAWDAIGSISLSNNELEKLQITGKWANLLPSIPEGHNYLWHTERGGGLPLFGWRTRYWSFLLKLEKSRPAWTISATPGPATGPFHWSNRKLSISEMLRLQTFPYLYKIAGDDISARRQIGNAVPSALAEFLGVQIRNQFFGDRVCYNGELLPSYRNDSPHPENINKVPSKYLFLSGNHAPHPGPGKGPGAIVRSSKTD